MQCRIKDDLLENLLLVPFKYWPLSKRLEQAVSFWKVRQQAFVTCHAVENVNGSGIEDRLSHRSGAHSLWISSTRQLSWPRAPRGSVWRACARICRSPETSMLQSRTCVCA